MTVIFQNQPVTYKETFPSKITKFIRLHTASSPRGSKLVHTIVTNNIVTDKITDTCRKLNINAQFYYPTEDYQAIQKMLSNILKDLTEEKIVFFFLTQDLFDFLYSDLMAWKDRQYFSSSTRADTLMNTNNIESKGRLFLIVRVEPMSINLEMITRLSDYTLFDSI